MRIFVNTEIRPGDEKFDPGYATTMTPLEFGAALRGARRNNHPRRTQTEVAVYCGVTQSTYTRMEAGDFKEFQLWMLKAARFVGLDILPSDIGLEIASTEIRSPNDQSTSFFCNLALYGCSVSHNNTWMISNTAIDLIPMPAFLANVSGSYSVLVADESMHPEFRTADVALLNPHLPPRQGRACLFRENMDGGRALLRILVRDDGDRWVVASHNPQIEVNLPKSEYPICHSVVGRYDR